MDGRKLTPPMAIVKNEPETVGVAKAETTQSVLETSLVSTTSTAKQAASRTSGIQFTTLPDIDITPRFRSILDATIHSQPDLVERRYQEFLVREGMTDKPVVHTDHHIKLFAILQQKS